MIRKTDRAPAAESPVTRAPFPGSRKIHVSGTNPGVRVPMREIEGDDVRDDLIESVPDSRLADIAEAQRTDDATDLLAEIPEERRERVLDEIQPDVREEIEELAEHAAMCRRIAREAGGRCLWDALQPA